MKNTLGYLCLSALLSVFPVALPVAADTPAAQTAPDLAQETPLMIIRFNERHVDYPTPLYNTISRALQVKPDAVFDVVSVATRTYDEKNQGYYNNIAEQNTHKVLDTLHQIGVPASRISLTNAIDNVSASEVRIYVH